MNRFLLFAVLVVAVPASATAQQAFRPGGVYDDPTEKPRDVSGFSIRGPRVRVVHTTDPSLAGGSMYLQQADPWLGYLMGREMLQREWRAEDGVFGETTKPDGLLLPDGATHEMTRDHVNSCSLCHNTPYRDAGAGLTMPKSGGTGRNAPHLFGGGLLEMLGAEIRLAALRQADDNRDGWIDLVEAKDKRFVYETMPEGTPGAGAALDFGRFDDHNLDGQPDLNPILHVVYCDGQGKRIAWAESLTTPGVKGYRLEVQVYAHSRLRVSDRPPLSGTLRAFIAGAFDIHHGLQAYDPTMLADEDHDTISGVSNAGCVQFISAAGRDRGRVLTPNGISADDPDRDGICHELTEGDLDVAEWYLLNHPRPARGRQTAATRRGEALFTKIGCTACHVSDWHIPAAQPAAADYTQRHSGDRRFFNVDVTWNEARRRLEGRVQKVTDPAVTDRAVPKRGDFVVRGLYSDLRYHDLGKKFQQVQFDGTVVRQFRTSPLWGVGSTAPYGHDGASLDLDDVIVRHGGEAQAATELYLALSDEEQCALHAFLRSLVLYQTDQLPCDVDGDGLIAEDFVVAGQHVGPETLRPEWLLKVPCRIEGPVVNHLGQKVTSFAVTNVRESYGLQLPYLRDTDRDGWPDVFDPEPHRADYARGGRTAVPQQ